MEAKKYIQNQSDVQRHCEEARRADEAISLRESDEIASSGLHPPRNDNKNSNIAVLIVNFGGPHSLRSVKPFLYNLFSHNTDLTF